MTSPEHYAQRTRRTPSLACITWSGLPDTIRSSRGCVGGRLCSRHSDLAMMVTEYFAFSTKNTEASTAGVRLRISLAGFLARARGAFTSDQ